MVRLARMLVVRLGGSRMTQRNALLRVLLLPFVVLCGLAPAHAVYDLPDDDSGCPANCRQVPWRAGSDLWSGGALPVYPAVECGGLVEGDGTTDNAPAIQSCIDSAAADTAVLLPAGMYYVNAALTLKSRVVLRGAGGGPGAQGTWMSSTYHGDVGAGATVTTLKLGPNAYVETPGSGSLGSTVSLASGFGKGSTSLTTSSAHGLAVGDWIVVSENQGDTDIPTSWTGQDGDCTWCGESNASGYLMTQIVQVASVSSSTTITLGRPLYYSFKAALAPRLRKVSMGGQKTGLESIKLWGSSNARTSPHISIEGCVYCWVKDVETYNTPDVAKGYPVWLYRSYGNEIRDSYFHFGQGNGGDRNYGIGIFGPNSDHKVENNILRENRHSLSQEGGGSGNVFLYNYVDDMYTDDLSIVGNTTLNHGAHPYMTLLEGNIVSHLAADRVWGTSSHLVLFRNWLWGDATGDYAAWTSSQPDWGFVAVEIDRQQTFYSAVGNVLGNPDLHTDWSSALLLPTSCGSVISSRAQPKVYSLGCDGEYSGPYDATVRATLILHGNYDYRTMGVAHWEGGSDHALRDSMYYTSKPAFMGSCPWPAYGPDLSPITGRLPAQDRYEGVAGCSAVTDGGVMQDAAQPDGAQPDGAAQDAESPDAVARQDAAPHGGSTEGGCGCRLGAGAPGGGVALVLLALVGVARRPRARRGRAQLCQVTSNAKLSAVGREGWASATLAPQSSATPSM
jgi:hypothetical protein